MKYKIIILLLTSHIFFSCCRKESIETARYELFPYELELIPYSKGERVNFIHSNGYTFNFNVIEDNIKWFKYFEFCEFNCCGLDYYSYQVRTTKLESSYPRFEIEISIGGMESNGYLPQVLNIQINNDYYTSLPYDSTGEFICDSTVNAVFLDSLEINGTVYYDVIDKTFDYHRPSDSTLMMPKSIFYNKLGILQIKITDDETYSLNN